MADGGIPHEGTNSVALTFKLDIGALRSSSQLSGAPPDDILESNKMLKNQKKNSNLICVFQLNAAWTTSYTRWKAKMRCYQTRKKQTYILLSPKRCNSTKNYMIMSDTVILYGGFEGRILLPPGDQQIDYTRYFKREQLNVRSIFSSSSLS